MRLRRRLTRAAPSLRLIAALCLFLVSTAAALADQACLLDDLSLAGRWRPDPWSRAPGTVSLVADAPEGAAGHTSLEVRTDWPADDAFRFFSLQPQPSRGPIPYRLKEVSLSVRGGGDPHFLEVHFKDAKGGDLKLGFGAPSFQGWRRLTRPVPAEAVQPLTLTSITWHSWGLKGAGGSVVSAVARLEGVIDESQRLVPGPDAPELLVAPEGPCGLADAEGQCVVDVSLLSWRQEPRKLTLSEEWLTSDGAALGRTQSDLDFAGEQARTAARQLPACGCFRYVATLSEPGHPQPLARAEARLARVVPACSLTPEERLRSPMGVNTHLGAPWEAFGRLGIHWARDYSWGWLGRGETAPVGNGRDFAAVWGEARRQGVIVLPTLQGAFRNKAETGFLEDSAAVTAGFERLAKALPEVPLWEMDNEYEYALRDKGFDTDDYARALRAAADGLKRSGPARLVPNGTAGIRGDLAQALLGSDARDAMAVINSHCYTRTAPPELGVSDTNASGAQRQPRLTMLDQLTAISRLAHGAGKESWLTEIGWDVTNGPAVGETRQAQYLPRAYLLARACGMDKVFWFYDRDVPGSNTIFSTCGLIRLDGSLRPSGVAMAALSRETARARPAGTLDFGPDIRAVVLAQPDATWPGFARSPLAREARSLWTVAVWSVEQEHPLPEGFAEADACDLFGNATKPQRLTPSILYFHFRQLPRAWDLQRQAYWDAPTVLTAAPGGQTEVRLVAPGAKVTWGQLPPDVTSAGWHEEGAARLDTLRTAVTAQTGKYPLTVTVQGDGWQRTFAASLLVEPALTVAGSLTYEPEQPDIKTISSAHLSGTVTARLLGDAGIVAPARFALAPGQARRIAVVPGPGAAGALTLELGLDNGVRQTIVLYPIRQTVPRLAASEFPGNPHAWPEGTLCPGERQGEASLRVGWSDAGLVIAAEVPVAFLTEGKPESFWDSTNLELFVDPSAGSGKWTSACKQVWFTPVKADRGDPTGEGWRVACGLWDRLTSKGAVADPRLKAAIVKAGRSATLVGLVPAAVLGRPPAPGDTWRLAITAHGVCPTDTLDLGWPRRKGDGLLEGPGNWGIVTFE